jgi:hypothetical protein
MHSERESSLEEPLLVDGFQRQAAHRPPHSKAENYGGRPGEAKQAAREAPVEAEKNRFSSLPRRKESRRPGPYR